MKFRSTHFGVHENTASPRQHASRLVINASVLHSDRLSTTEQPETSTHQPVPPIKQTFELSLTGPELGKGATEGEENGAVASARFGNGQRLSVERPLTCEEAAAFVRAHPKTVKRMARRGDLPGYFRFGRWFFYASELDRWMHGELHSTHRPCR
jgi:excisionase family DNA binding protein